MPWRRAYLLMSKKGVAERDVPERHLSVGDEWGADYKTDKGAGWSGALGRRGPEMDLDDGKSGLPSLLQCLA